MKKLAFLVAIALLVGFAFSPAGVFAMPGFVTATNTRSGVNVIIPAHAVQVADNVFSLGTAIDPQRGDIVEGFAIVDYRTGYGHKPNHNPGGGNGNGNGGGGGASSCFGFLAKNAKWKTVEPWVVNPTNSDGITDASVFAILDGGISKWEDAADGIVDGNFVDILGVGSITADVLVADTVAMDNVNEVYFDLLGEGTIGVTIVWGVFNGPPFARELREWDQIYNTFYAWSDTGAVGEMDLDNIVTHELGHSVGLGDLYENTCSEETMYGFADFGETNKRDLNAGDIEGVSKLY